MNEPRSFRVTAVVLRHADWGEADRILTLFTREKGKMRVVAKGVRKLRSRKAGHLEPFTQVALQLARGREMAIVTQADTVEAYLSIREDLVKTGYAAYAMELLDRFSYEEEVESTMLFYLLTDTLGRIALEADAWLAIRFYEMRLLDHLGFRPQLVRCSNCEREIKAENQFFSPCLTMYPLPATNTLTLEWKGKNEIRVKIFSPVGSLITEFMVDEKKVLYVTNLVPGEYSLIFTVNTQEFTEKVVLK